MKKPVFVLSVLVIGFSCLHAQDLPEDERVLKSVVENILAHTSYDFVNSKTGEVLTEISREDYSPNLRIRSPYNTWSYWNGVVNIAMLKLGDYFTEPEYSAFVHKNYAFAFEYAEIFKNKGENNSNKWNYPFGQLLITRELDDCGAMGGGLIEAYKRGENEEYRAYIDKAADHMLNKQERLSDGTLVRHFPHEMTIWGDDLYMSIVFLARMGDLTGDQKYFDDAAKQVRNFTKYLYNSNTQLYSHCYYTDVQKNGVAHWGRCNGWIIMAQADLLEYLPPDHPDRDELISILYQQILGAAKYQSITGLWHQILDKNDSYLETSATAMITYAVAKAVNKGWIDKRYQSIAKNGWEGIKTKIQDDGQVQGVCAGTGIQDNLIFYYKRPTPLNDIHGLGAVLLAGLEVLKMIRAEE